MSKSIKEVLEDLAENYYPEHEYNDMWRERNAEQVDQALLKIQEIIKECIGEMEYQNTEDMTLQTWSAEDLKAFGRNELRNEIRTELEKRLK